ncbi:MAG: DUF370 domain-containing protein [Clostridia bacterium]|nr:DUF370 domain-containing protein [Clostridia bacterium]
MYVSVGGDVILRSDEIVCVLDAATARAGRATRELLGRERARGRVVEAPGGAARAIVVCTGRVVLSPFTPARIRARVEAFSRPAGGGSAILDARRIGTNGVS